MICTLAENGLFISVLVGDGVRRPRWRRLGQTPLLHPSSRLIGLRRVACIVALFYRHLTVSVALLQYLTSFIREAPC